MLNISSSPKFSSFVLLYNYSNETRHMLITLARNRGLHLRTYIENPPSLGLFEYVQLLNTLIFTELYYRTIAN